MTNYDYFSKGFLGLFETTYTQLVREADNDIDAKCMSYAVWKSMQVILKYSERIAFFRDIDQLPDEILDYLAVEWRIPYYDSELDISIKRKLLKRGFTWCMEAGTVGAVEEMITMVFGEGKVTEWMEYGGNPGMFRILTNAILTEEIDTTFTSILRKVKNVRSHIEAIEIHREVPMPIYNSGAINASYVPERIEENLKEKNRSENSNCAGAQMQYYVRNPRIQECLKEKNIAGNDVYGAVGISEISRTEIIQESLRETAQTIQATNYAGLALDSIYEKNTIESEG